MRERDWESLTKDSNYSHWVKRKDRFYPTNVTHPSLPAGVYEAKEDTEGGVFLREIEFPADLLLSMPGMPTDYILDQIEKFWQKEEVFEKQGLLFKRGVLLYGPSGCGKTSILHQLAQGVMNRDGVVLSVLNIECTQSILLQLREIEPSRPVMTIFEDIEKLMEREDCASDILSFLDGEKQISNIIHIATTNKPDVLEDRLIKRPGRFDLVIGLNPPIADARRVYLNRLFNGSSYENRLDEMVEQTEGMGLAHLRELAVATICLEQSYEQTLTRLRNNIKETIKMPKVGQKTEAGYTLGFTQEVSE